MTAALVKPYIFVDLDDTLFQTNRRCTPSDHFTIATLDKTGNPLSFMNPKQKMFVDWMNQTGKLIAVTARSVEALSRVKLSFEYGAVCSHGGTVLNADGSVDQQWHAQVEAVLKPYQPLLQELIDLLMEAAKPLGSIRTWIVEENGLGLYAVAKQNEPVALFLRQLIKQLPEKYQSEFYMHSNGNNLAIIPKVISKAFAVRYLMQHKLEDIDHSFLLGFGDSLSDIEFLAECDWFGLPKSSQTHQWVAHHLDNDYQSKGYFGHDH